MLTNQRTQNHSRRHFLSILGKGFISACLAKFLLGCTSFGQNKDWSQIPSEEFDYKAFNKWYKANRLYNKNNPLVASRIFGKFSTNFRHDWTPGINYRGHGDMIAIAPGRVYVTEELRTGRMGGLWVRVLHPSRPDGMTDAPYTSAYAHLSSVKVKGGQIVKRGQVIGTVKGNYIPKLMLSEKNNYVDPDNYGPGYSYMDYFKGPLESDEECCDNYESLNNKLWKQWQITFEIDKKRTGWLNDNLDKWHSRGSARNRSQACQWSRIEKFRYLETLYKLQHK
jgi:hypothetical protein